MFFNNAPKRPMPPPPMRPAPRPVRGPNAFASMFGNSGFGQPIAPVQQGNPITPQPTQGPNAFSGMFGNSGFGQPIAPIPQQPFNPVAPGTGMFGGNFAPNIAPAPQQPTQGPSAFAGMFGNGGFGQPQQPFTSAFGQPIARAPQQPTQQPQPATGLAGLGTMSPEQITQLQNNLGPQTLPANINQQLGMMRPGGLNSLG